MSMGMSMAGSEVAESKAMATVGHLVVWPQPTVLATAALMRRLAGGGRPNTELPYMTAGSHPCRTGFLACLRNLEALWSLSLFWKNLALATPALLFLPWLAVTPRSLATEPSCTETPVVLRIALCMACPRPLVDATMIDFVGLMVPLTSMSALAMVAASLGASQSRSRSSPVDWRAQSSTKSPSTEEE